MGLKGERGMGALLWVAPLRDWGHTGAEDRMTGGHRTSDMVVAATMGV